MLSDREALGDLARRLGEGPGEVRVRVGDDDRVASVSADTDRGVEGNRAYDGEVVSLGEALCAAACEVC